MKTETLAALQQARTKRTAVTLATRLSDAAKTMIYLDRADGALAGDAALVSAARRAMAIGRSETIDLGGQKIFLNVYVPPPRLIIVATGLLHGDALRPEKSLRDQSDVRHTLLLHTPPCQQGFFRGTACQMHIANQYHGADIFAICCQGFFQYLHGGIRMGMH